MNKELENIFVPVEVAKLAKQKGFKDWCACYKEEPRYSELANVRGDLGWYYGKRENSKNIVAIPTHFQLIKWLKDKHDVDLRMEFNGIWSVIDTFGANHINSEGETEFEINEALEIGLKAIN